MAIIHKLETGAAIVDIGACCYGRVAVGIVGNGKAVRRGVVLVQENDARDFTGDCARGKVVLEFCTGLKEG